MDLPLERHRQELAEIVILAGRAAGQEDRVDRIPWIACLSRGLAIDGARGIQTVQVIVRLTWSQPADKLPGINEGNS